MEFQVVGVFNNIPNGGGLRSDYPEIYVPFWQSPWPSASVAVRASGDPASVTSSIAAAVNSIDPDLPLAGVRTMEQHIEENLAFDSFGMVLYASFAVFALLLAAVGVYGVMSFGVAQRTHEFGLRMALGARSANILSLVLREAGTLALIGMGIGLGGAYLVGRMMQATLFRVGALDAFALSAVTCLLLMTALLACYLPARRATKVDPIIALRHE